MKTADETMREAVSCAGMECLDTPWVRENGDWIISPDSCRRIILAALRALDAAGWQCVPREATEEMLAAAGKAEVRCAAQNYGGSPSSDEYWSAMVTAAPRLPGVER